MTAQECATGRYHDSSVPNPNPHTPSIQSSAQMLPHMGHRIWPKEHICADHTIITIVVIAGGFTV